MYNQKLMQLFIHQISYTLTAVKLNDYTIIKTSIVKEGVKNTNVDKISQLPEHIIIHEILCRLDEKVAARTS